MPAVGLLLLPPQLPVGDVRSPPGEHRLGKDVVEDLVPGAGALLHRAQDPPLRQRREDRLQPSTGTPAELSEVGHVVRDLRAGGRNEVVEEPGSDVLLRP